MKGITTYLLTVVLVLLTGPAWAGSVTIPNTFSSGTKAKAAEVNANFAALKLSVDDNDARLTALENQLAALQTSLTNANNTIAILQSQLSAINNSNVMALDPYVSLSNDSRGPVAIFSGLNLQLVNGTGTTGGTPNGLGNMIIGYDTDRTSGSPVCSNGGYSDQSSCEGAGGTWAVSQKTGSHYLVIGDQNNYSQYGGLVVGAGNISNARYASVSGGVSNTASGAYSSVSGGVNNVASQNYASVSGGYGNTANGIYASVSGGLNNTANGSESSVSGGSGNTASGFYASVSGGTNNTVSGTYASVSGGVFNIASGIYASVSGGVYNMASGSFASVNGGGDGTVSGGNTASYPYSSILGGVGQSTTSNSQTIPALP